MSLLKYTVFLIFVLFSSRNLALLNFFAPIWWVWDAIGILALSWIVTVIVNNLIVRNACRRFFVISSTNKAVLITGCDTGFGRISALILNRLGYHVFAGCLDAKSESAASLSREAASHQNMTVLQLDVTKGQEIIAAHDKVCKILQQRNMYLHAIINNAGINIPGMIEFAGDACVADYEAVFNVNVLGAIRVCRMFAPLLRDRKGVTEPNGRIVNVSSQAAQSIAYGQSAYCMSKAALSVFTEALGTELSGFGMQVILIEPFFYKTQEANVPTFVRRIRDAWKQTRQEVRDAYGIEVLEGCVESNKFFATSDLAVNGNISEVPELIVEAVTTMFPDVLYVKVPILPHCLLTILRSMPYDLRFELNKHQSLLNQLLIKYGRKGVKTN